MSSPWSRIGGGAKFKAGLRGMEERTPPSTFSSQAPHPPEGTHLELVSSGPEGVQLGWVLPGLCRTAGDLTCPFLDSHHLRWSQDIWGMMLIPASKAVAVATGGQGPCLG